MKNDTPVVVLYHGGNGAVAIARTLGRLGVPMYLVAKKDASPIQRSRYWRERFWWDFSARPEDTLEFLLDVGKRIGGRPVLLTLADWIAVFIERHAAELEQAFVFPRSREPVIERLANKWSMFDLAHKCGIPTPQTVYPQSRADLEAFLATTEFPVVMKAADPFRSYVPAKAIAANAAQAIEKFDDDALKGPTNLIVQEYIPGGPEDVWMCNAYFTGTSECRAIYTGRKLRQMSSTGVASLAVCEPNTEVENLTRTFMQSVGYAGAVGIGYRYDARDGKYKVLDVNPRVSGVFRLFAGTSGMDAVRACYLDLTGQSVPESSVIPGRKWMLEDDVFAARGQKISLRKWLQSVRGVRELQWFAADDPLPGLAWMSSQLRARAAERLARRSAPADEREYDVIRHHWNTRAGTFDREWSQGLLSDEQHEAWLETLERIAGRERKRVLDVGCGTGFLSLLLAELGHDVTGIDLAPQMLEVAREKAERSGLKVRFRVENAASLSDAQATYDLVICRHVIWILPDPARGASEWIRVLRPGGRLALIEGKWWDAGAAPPPPTLRSRMRTVADGALGAAARVIGVQPRNLYARNYQRLQSKLPFSGGAEPSRLLTLLETQGLRDVRMQPLTDRALWGRDPDGLRYAALGTREPYTAGVF